MMEGQKDLGLKEKAATIRQKVLNLCYSSGSGHVGSSFSVVEILTTLYFSTMNHPDRPRKMDERDRIILSKGHGCPALYATLCMSGLISEKILEGFAMDGGTLEQHPTRNKEYGIDVSSGSLGHGLSIGAGMALAAKSDDKDHRVFVIMSDGETNEGSTWEAALFAAQNGIDNLVAIIDYNKMQALGKTMDIIGLDPFVPKWEAMGWEAREVDGHDFSQLIPALEAIPFRPGKPSVIIAHTVKGKGVCFMENQLLWHYRCPDDKEYQKAIRELCK